MKAWFPAVLVIAAAVACGDPLALENADDLTGWILYADPSGELAVLDLPHGKPRWITSGPGTRSSPRWSPDRQRIAFILDGGAGRQLFVMDSDGTRPAIVYTGGYVESPSWSPDGKKLVFDVADSGPGVMLINTDGSGRSRLTRGRDPYWSPSGDFIVFDDSGAVMRIGIDGTGRTRLTHQSGANAAPDGGPVVSPNGTHVAFIRHSAPAESLYVINADGTGEMAIYDRPVALAWSPSSTAVAFLRIDGGSFAGPDAAIHVINADGTHERRIIALTPWDGMDWR